MKPKIFSAFVLSLFLSCGSGEETSVPDVEREPSLQVSVSVGEEMGDSCYVFGDIQDACLMEDGRILVLDGVTCEISCYSPNGEFIERTGGSGEGPGEFIRPYSMISLSDGRVAVTDPGMTRMTFLDSDLSVDTVISGFIPWSPERISPSSGGSYTGSYRIFNREDSMYGKLLALWRDSPVQEYEYYNRVAPFNRERLRESTEECEIVFTSDFSGNVYYSPYSYERFDLTVLDSEGNVLYTIEENREPRERPREDIEREREDMMEQLQNEGAPPEMQWNPSEYRAMVPMRGLGVDNQGRLWVRDGREETPVFDVYLRDSHLFRASLVSDMDDLENLRVKVTERGMIAWCPDPEFYPEVHVLTLTD